MIIKKRRKTLQEIGNIQGISRQAVWLKTKKGKAYQKTDKWKAYQKAYQKTDKYKAYRKAYYLKKKGATK